MNAKREQAKRLYEHNKKYVAENQKQMTWKELSAFSRKQDELYKISIGERA